MSNRAARVLLVYPPSRTQGHAGCPLGMLMLASVLEQAGHRVELLDANAARRRLTTADVVRRAEQLRPDVIGVTLLTPLVKEAYRLAGQLRSCGAKLIAGGPHATLLSEEPLDHGFEAVVVGEGEPTIVEAVEALLGRLPLDSVRGIVYRGGDGQIRHNPPSPPVADLDTLPLPARHLVNPADFGPPANDALHSNLFSSRGCPGRCAYCAGGLFGKEFRFRSADNVVDEMILLYRRFGTRHFHFVDDAASMDKQRMRQICLRLENERLGLSWSMMTRIDSVDEEMLDRAARAGCVQIDYGVESGSRETLKRIHKPHTPEMVRRVIPCTRRHGIQPLVFFILGFPWEDLGAVEETWDLMREIAPYVTFHPAVASLLVPFPGTEIYDRYQDRYGFANWWLSDDRAYDAPRLDTHPYYQTVLYRIGAVLDADFFHYSPDMRAKIHEVFRFMYASNLRNRGVAARAARLLALDLSRRLHALSPAVERAVFKGASRLRQALRQGRDPTP